MRLLIMCSLLVLVVLGAALGQQTKNSDPCANPQSQAEMTMCAGKKYKAADAVLNQVYRQLVARLDAEEKEQLKQAQSAWLKYRDANCDFVADQFKGGTMRPMVAAMCLADMTKNRTAELRTQIKDRDQ